jgi:glutamine synthetase
VRPRHGPSEIQNAAMGSFGLEDSHQPQPSKPLLSSNHNLNLPADPTLFTMHLALSFALLASSAVGFQIASVSNRLSSTSLNVGVLVRETGKSQLDPAVLDRFNALPFPKDQVLAEYVWLDADGNTRSKTRTLPAKKVREVADDKLWSFQLFTYSPCTTHVIYS